MLTLDKIYHAGFILKKIARKTDLIAAPNLKPGADIFLKTENLQVTGSFKVRGSYYKISQLTEEEKKKGVIACSAGNHAQGVALAASSMNIASTIFMPDAAPIMKVENTKRLGAVVELVPGTYDDAHDRAVELQKETGMTFIHPYDDELVIAGQLHLDLSFLQLCFLQAEKIRVQLFKSFHKALAHHRAQAVHVPGYHFHRSFTPFFSFSAVPARVFYHKSSACDNRKAVPVPPRHFRFCFRYGQNRQMTVKYSYMKLRCRRSFRWLQFFLPAWCFITAGTN